MIISPGRNYIFVHIPKTGGTALALALEDRAMADDILIGDTPKAQRRRKRLKGFQSRGRLWKHSTLADADGAIPDGMLESALIVTLVRNPWDRLVSYYHWLRAQSFDHPAVQLARSVGFAAFLDDPHTRHSLSHSPARRYVTDATGQERPALFLRLEHFSADAEPLFDHLGFRFDLPIANQSERQANHRGYYNDATRRIVAEICAEDIDRFGYQF